jgi:ankyrin repeat protein
LNRILIGLSLLLLHVNAFAQLSFTELKGLQEQVQLKPEYEYLNPLHGFNLAKQGLLTNLYKYPAVNEKEQPIYPFEMLVQSTFNIPPDSENPAFFQVSPLAKKFGRFLGPSTIGSILSVLADKDPKHTDKTALKDLKAELEKAIQGDPEFNKRVDDSNEKKLKIQKDLAENKDLGPYLQEIKQLEVQLSEKKVAINKLGSAKRKSEREQDQCRKESNPDESKIQELAQMIEEATQQSTLASKELESLNQELATKKQALQENESYRRLKDKEGAESYKKEYLNTFISRLLDSWIAEGNSENHYPRHATEQILLTLAWMNTPDEGRNQFLHLYEKIPHVLKHGKIVSHAHPEEKYKKSDYDHLVKQLLDMKSPSERAHYLLGHPEQAAFLTYSKNFFDPSSFPEIGFKQVVYQHSTKGPVYFPDCMDSSILNAMAIFLRDPATGNLNTKFLQDKLKSQELKLHPQFKEFIKTHPDTSQLDTLKSHEEWAPLISELKNVKYVNDGYEMDTTISNLLNSMEHLLTGGEKTKSSSSLWAGLNKNSKKLDKLCELLSRNGMTFGWKVKSGDKEDLNHKESNLSLVFEINGKPAFTWKISSGHSEIKTEKTSGSDWQSQLTPELASLLAKKQKEHSITDLDHQTLNWFLKPNEIAKTNQTLGFKEGSNASIHLALSAPLSRVESKLEVINELLASREPANLNRISKIAKGLPETDLHTQARFVNSILKHQQESPLRSSVDHFFSYFNSPAEKKLAVTESASNGYLDLLKKLVENKFSVSEKDREGKTPLHHAASRGQFATAQFLAKEHPHALSEKDHLKRTPLHLAASQGNLETVQFLVKKHPQAISEKDTFERTPLHLAASQGNLETVQFLVKKHPQAISEKDHLKRTPLHLAASQGNLETVQFLVKEHPQAISEKDDSKRTPLHEAASQGNLETVQFLAKEYPQAISEKGDSKKTPLHLAAEKGSLETVQFLFEKYPQAISEKDFLRRTPFYLAVGSGNLETVQYLFEKYPQAISEKSSHGFPFGLAFTLGDLQILQFLAEKDLQALSKKNIDGYTPLHYAALDQKWDKVQILVRVLKDHPEQLSLKDDDGNTLLDFARKYNQTELIRYLESIGVKE